MTQNHTVETLEFAASTFKNVFTTLDIAQALKTSKGTAAALLACRSRNGRVSQILKDPEGWKYVSEASKGAEETVKATKKATLVEDDEALALEGLHALSRLNGSGYKVVALFLVQEALQHTGWWFSFKSADFRNFSEETAKVKKEVLRLLGEASCAFNLTFEVSLDGFQIQHTEQDSWAP